MADIITVAEYKAFLGIDPTNTRDDLRVAAMIPAASSMIRAYTDRDFSLNGGALASARSFEYDGSGFLDINDATSVISVSTDGGVTGGQAFVLDNSLWSAEPQGGPVSYYLRIWGAGPLGGVSPQMGFERNLDQYEFYGKPPLLTVAAVWGWTAIPADVKLAATWTVQDTLASSNSGQLQSEAIAGYARSWSTVPAGAGGMLAIPNRARDILANYERAY